MHQTVQMESLGNSLITSKGKQPFKFTKMVPHGSACLGFLIPKDWVLGKVVFPGGFICLYVFSWLKLIIKCGPQGDRYEYTFVYELTQSAKTIKGMFILSRKLSKYFAASLMNKGQKLLVQLTFKECFYLTSTSIITMQRAEEIYSNGYECANG